MKKKTNYREFIPIGVCFMGAGIVFISVVNKGVGLGMLGIGLAYLAIGLAKTRKKTKFKI